MAGRGGWKGFTQSSVSQRPPALISRLAVGLLPANVPKGARLLHFQQAAFHSEQVIPTRVCFFWQGEDLLQGFKQPSTVAQLFCASGSVCWCFFFLINSLWGLLFNSSFAALQQPPTACCLLPQVGAGEAELAAGSSTGEGERLMENPIWFNSGKLEGDEGGRKLCLACVQAADCIGLSLETLSLAAARCLSLQRGGLSFWCCSASHAKVRG